MKQIRPLLLLLAVFLPTTSVHAAPALKVVSWNPEWFPGHLPTASAAEADEHMKLVRETFKAIKPDSFIAIGVRDSAGFHEPAIELDLPQA